MLHSAPVTSARNLGVIFDSNLSFSEHMSAVSKSCFQHIRDLRRIRSSVDYTTALTIAASHIHTKLDYCNSLFKIFHPLINRLQHILNAAASAVTNTPKFFCSITPVLMSLHWLKKNIFAYFHCKTLD